MGTAHKMRATGMSAPRAARNLVSAFGMIAMVAGLSACAGNMETTGSVPERYQDRHPILLTRAPEVIYVPVSARGGDLADGDREMIAGFVARFRDNGDGPIHVLAPSGSANEAAASYAARGIRTTLGNFGLADHEIVMTSYQIVDPAYSAPVKLAYETLQAVTGECGYWPEDIGGSSANRSYWNFGCATQKNFAAQLTEPRDLITPRSTTPRDGQRRTTVFEKYRKGEPTATQTADEDDGKISEVGN